MPSRADHSSEPWLDTLLAGEPDDAALAEALVDRGVAVAAGMRRGEVATTRKTSVSDIVTAADHAAERDIVAALRRLRPDDSVVGEEGAQVAGVSGRTWIVDPLDGTYNYATGIGDWCSAIALRGPDGALTGAVRGAAASHAWVGVVTADGSGTLWCNGIAAPRLRDVELAEVAVATYVHPTRMTDPDAIDPWLAALRGSATIRMLGSGSLDLVAVAAGRFGAFLQSGTADWDWYPGLALVRAAGGEGQVVHHRGHRWHVAGAPRVVTAIVTQLTAAGP